MKMRNENTVARGFDREWAAERAELRSTLPMMASSRQRWQLSHGDTDDRLSLEDAFEQLADMAMVEA